MKHALLFVLFLLGSSMAFCQQSEPMVSLRLENAPAVELLNKIEQSTPYRFFYVKSWLDSIRVSVDVDNERVSAVLKSAFRGTSIQFYIDGNRIILTDNVPILTGIDPAFFDRSADSVSSDANYTFKREYVPAAQVEAKVENKVIEICIKQTVNRG
ncbi:MAG TPA: STN domain-containing protein, partial [Cyclobacteriaceae bacterium]|nr:STN domain-containing protein [Cyclobacteriaceae bacterium]